MRGEEEGERQSCESVSKGAVRPDEVKHAKQRWGAALPLVRGAFSPTFCLPEHGRAVWES